MHILVEARVDGCHSEAKRNLNFPVFPRATDGSSLCSTFNFPCGNSQPSGALVVTTTSTTTTSTTTTKTVRDSTANKKNHPDCQVGLTCSQPCDLSLALGSLMQTYHTGLYNVLGNYQHLVLQSDLFLSSSNVIVQLVLLGIGSQQWPTWQQDTLAQQVHHHTHHKPHCQ